jgi:hypothetical protein
MSRGSYAWQLTIPDDGRLRLEGLLPALIEWQSAPPVEAMPDMGIQILDFELSHPEVAFIREELDRLGFQGDVLYHMGREANMALRLRSGDKVVRFSMK